MTYLREEVFPSFLDFTGYKELGLKQREGKMRNKIKIISVLLLISVFAILNSCQRQKAEWKGTIEELDGVTVVKNPKEPMYEEDILILEEELSIENEEVEEEYLFQNVTRLVVDDEENIYVCDSKAAHIIVFDSKGNHLRTIGKRGQGPGEMMWPGVIQVFLQEELIVTDLPQARVHFFTLDGKFLRQLSTRTRAWFRGPKVDSKGNMVVEYGIFGDENKTVVKKIDSELKPIFDIVSLPLASRPPNLISYFEWRYGNMVWDVSKEDNIIWGDITKYEIYVYNPEGKLIKKVIRDYEGVEVTKAEEEKLWKDWYGDIPIPPQMKLEFPKKYPPFMHFTCDENGRYIVQTYDKTEDGERNYYDVFDSEGKYIARISLKFSPIIWKKNKLYTIEEDDEGFQVVKCYKVTWNY